MKDNSQLLELLARLSTEDNPQEKDLKQFYNLFLSQQLISLRRDQPVEVPTGAKYENDFSDLLGIAIDNETFIPVFTDEEALKEWFQGALETTTIKGSDLCRRTPEGWSITLNPGSESGKEFSWWEVSRLASGHDESISEVILEQIEDTSTPLSLREITEQEEKSLKEVFTDISNIDEIKETPFKAYAGIKITSAGDHFVLGVMSTAKLNDDQKHLFKSAIDLKLIGNLPFDIFFAENPADTAETALFTFAEPIFSHLCEKPAHLSQKISDILGFSKK